VELINSVVDFQQFVLEERRGTLQICPRHFQQVDGFLRHGAIYPAHLEHFALGAQGTHQVLRNFDDLRQGGDGWRIERVRHGVRMTS
jgi:hypothetical protein